MRISFDSSALAKRYIVESGSDRVGQVCAQAQEVILSIVCIAEVVSALNRLRREKKLSTRKYHTLKQDFVDDVEQATIVPLNERVLAIAINALEKAPLRTLDAIQIASAINASCDLFISADKRQSQAATALGLHVEQIAL